MPTKKKEQKNEDIKIYDEYFNYTKELKTNYGERSIVLMLVGAFFEVYGLKDIETQDITKSNLIDFKNICNLNVADKMEIENNQVIVMAGFRDYALEKNLSMLIAANYNVAVYIQDKTQKKIIRKLDKIYSPGTHVSFDCNNSHKLSNNIMSIWIENFKQYKSNEKLLVCGATSINIFTGDVYMFQNEKPYYMSITSFDELERFVSIHQPSEILIIYDEEDNDIQQNIERILQYSGVNKEFVKIFSLHENKVNRCQNQNYIKEIIISAYDNDAFDICEEFSEYTLSTQSMCYLLEFVKQHNPKIIDKLNLPVYNNSSNDIILANHTLSQLNIINNDMNNSNSAGNLSCVMNVLNKCVTPMGKRLLQYSITHPSSDIDWLNNEYHYTDFVLKNMFTELNDIRKLLSKTKDLDKLLRQLLIQVLYPSNLYSIYETFDYVQRIVETMKEDKIYLYMTSDFNMKGNVKETFVNNLKFVLEYMIDHFNINACKMIMSMTTFSQNIIKEGVNSELDILQNKYNTSLNDLHFLQEFLNTCTGNAETNDWVKIHETEKSGLSLQVTKTRSEKIKTWLKENNDPTMTRYKDSLKNQENCNIQLLKKFDIQNIVFTKAGSSNVDITEEIISGICKKITLYKNQLNEVIEKVYIEELLNFQESCFEKVEFISKGLSKLDLILNKAYVSSKYCYCKPEINSKTKDEKSFFEAKGLRHALIERINSDEIYVENDISLGGDINGVLLYGTNAVGKTSLIRAIGVCIIMAQSGFYVPCSRFIFKPYKAIFSRILGNDNLFKGLSTFAVEMSELRTILQLADENSLILGDELCSGTETESALSIFVSGLEHLHKVKSSHIFATHFHEIVNYDEIKQLINLKLMHLEVKYNRELDCLVYDRKLKDGSGPRIYGLEVCKSLHMNVDFLDNAFKIRNKYFSHAKTILDFDRTQYNSNKIRGFCEICKKEVGTEIHHLQHQKEANDKGFINHFHKDHKANLISICEECHQKVHKEENKDIYPNVIKKTTKGRILTK
tara:strand:+ start:2020 stop:5067 length:3048 start_codon:yes stop_codon:yes gene_type:complete